MHRRNFVKYTATIGFGLSLPLLNACSDQPSGLNILVLGGTFFVGPAIVNVLLSSGHQVTLFNRGKTNPTLYPELKLIKGDRTKGPSSYEALKRQKWDVVIDVWPEKSQMVDEATQALQSNAVHYIFISSIAVYNDFQEVGLNENSKVISLPEDRSEWYYGEEKLRAEQLVQERYPNNYTILRPGPIKGWRDPALDLYYWCSKLKKDDTIIAPGSGMDPIQFVDVKDVGRFVAMACDQNINGVFNITGPRAEKLLWSEFLSISRKQLHSNTELIWAEEDFLRENEVYSFSDLPLWAPLSEDPGFMQISQQKLINTGFQFTPIESTIDDCIKWHEENGNADVVFGSEEVGIGLTLEKEKDLLQKLAVTR